MITGSVQNPAKHGRTCTELVIKEVKVAQITSQSAVSRYIVMAHELIRTIGVREL
jgi:hypothetical protein